MGSLCCRLGERHVVLNVKHRQVFDRALEIQAGVRKAGDGVRRALAHFRRVDEMERRGQRRLEEQAFHRRVALDPVSGKHQRHRSSVSVEVAVGLPHHPAIRQGVERGHQTRILRPVVGLKNLLAILSVGVHSLGLVAAVVPSRPLRRLVDTQAGHSQEKDHAHRGRNPPHFRSTPNPLRDRLGNGTNGYAGKQEHRKEPEREQPGVIQLAKVDILDDEVAGNRHHQQRQDRPQCHPAPNRICESAAGEHQDRPQLSREDGIEPGDREPPHVRGIRNRRQERQCPKGCNAESDDPTPDEYRRPASPEQQRERHQNNDDGGDEVGERSEGKQHAGRRSKPPPFAHVLHEETEVGERQGERPRERVLPGEGRQRIGAKDRERLHEYEGPARNARHHRHRLRQPHPPGEYIGGERQRNQAGNGHQLEGDSIGHEHIEQHDCVRRQRKVEVQDRKPGVPVIAPPQQTATRQQGVADVGGHQHVGSHVAAGRSVRQEQTVGPHEPERQQRPQSEERRHGEANPRAVDIDAARWRPARGSHGFSRLTLPRPQWFSAAEPSPAGSSGRAPRPPTSTTGVHTDGRS